MKTNTIYSALNSLGQECAVQFQYGSNNSKTGDGVQIFIIPMKWVIEGKSAMNDDSASCMDCIHGKNANRTCYVRKGQSEMGLKSKVASLHKHYTNGTLVIQPIELATAEVPKIRGNYVRFGAYGEPIVLGESLTKVICEASATWTGYTHQWRNPKYQWAKKYFMASADNERLGEIAQGMGWRTFRVRMANESAMPREVICPASKEGNRKATCNTCGLCKGASIKAKSIVIIKH